MASSSKYELVMELELLCALFVCGAVHFLSEEGPAIMAPSPSYYTVCCFLSCMLCSLKWGHLSRQLPHVVCPRVLNSELQPLLLSKAAHIGLPSRWIDRLAQVDPERWQVLTVRSCTVHSHAADVLKDNDMVLAVGGRPVSCFKDVENMILNGCATSTGRIEVCCVS